MSPEGSVPPPPPPRNSVPTVETVLMIGATVAAAPASPPSKLPRNAIVSLRDAVDLAFYVAVTSSSSPAADPFFLAAAIRSPGVCSCAAAQEALGGDDAVDEGGDQASGRRSSRKRS